MATRRNPPFTAKCEAYERMVQMFQSGELDRAFSPKFIYDSYPQLFSQYTLQSFRAQLNKYKTANGLMGVLERDAEEKPKLGRCNTG
jgi:hypothetical protein